MVLILTPPSKDIYILIRIAFPQGMNFRQELIFGTWELFYNSIVFPKELFMSHSKKFDQVAGMDPS